jgi:hypothetical protein
MNGKVLRRSFDRVSGKPPPRMAQRRMAAEEFSVARKQIARIVVTASLQIWQEDT